VFVLALQPTAAYAAEVEPSVNGWPDFGQISA